MSIEIDRQRDRFRENPTDRAAFNAYFDALRKHERNDDISDALVAILPHIDQPTSVLICATVIDYWGRLATGDEARSHAVSVACAIARNNRELGAKLTNALTASKQHDVAVELTIQLLAVADTEEERLAFATAIVEAAEHASPDALAEAWRHIAALKPRSEEAAIAALWELRGTVSDRAKHDADLEVLLRDRGEQRLLLTMLNERFDSADLSDGDLVEEIARLAWSVAGDPEVALDYVDRGLEAGVPAARLAPTTDWLAAQAGSSHPGTLRFAAEIQQAAGNGEAAISWYEHAAEAFSGADALACLLSATLIEAEAGNGGAVLKHLQTIADDAPDASIAIDAADRVKSSHPGVWSPTLADFRDALLREAGEWTTIYEEARARLDSVEPGDLATPALEVAGLESERLGRPDLAVATLASALKAAPTEAHPQLLDALKALADGDSPGAALDALIEYYDAAGESESLAVALVRRGTGEGGESGARTLHRAATIFERELDRPDAALARMMSAHDMQPRDTSILADVARLSAICGDEDAELHALQLLTPDLKGGEFAQSAARLAALLSGNGDLEAGAVWLLESVNGGAEAPDAVLTHFASEGGAAILDGAAARAGADANATAAELLIRVGQLTEDNTAAAETLTSALRRGVLSADTSRAALDAIRSRGGADLYAVALETVLGAPVSDLSEAKLLEELIEVHRSRGDADSALLALTRLEEVEGRSRGHAARIELFRDDTDALAAALHLAASDTAHSDDERAAWLDELFELVKDRDPERTREVAVELTALVPDHGDAWAFIEADADSTGNAEHLYDALCALAATKAGSDDEAELQGRLARLATTVPGREASADAHHARVVAISSASPQLKETAYAALFASALAGGHNDVAAETALEALAASGSDEAFVTRLHELVSTGAGELAAQSALLAGSRAQDSESARRLLAHAAGLAEDAGSADTERTALESLRTIEGAEFGAEHLTRLLHLSLDAPGPDLANIVAEAWARDPDSAALTELIGGRLDAPTSVEAARLLASDFSAREGDERIRGLYRAAELSESNPAVQEQIFSEIFTHSPSETPAFDALHVRFSAQGDSAALRNLLQARLGATLEDDERAERLAELASLETGVEAREPILRDLYALRPNDVSIVDTLSEYARDRGDLTELCALLEARIALSDESEARDDLRRECAALLCDRLDRAADARPHLEALVEHNHRDLASLSRLADMAAADGDHERAATLHEKAGSLLTGAERTRALGAALAHSDALDPNPERSIRLVSALADSDSRTEGWLERLAAELGEQDRWEEALGALRRLTDAVDADRQPEIVRRAAVVMTEHLGQHSDALRALQVAAQLGELEEADIDATLAEADKVGDPAAADALDALSTLGSAHLHGRAAVEAATLRLRAGQNDEALAKLVEHAERLDDPTVVLPAAESLAGIGADGAMVAAVYTEVAKRADNLDVRWEAAQKAAAGAAEHAGADPFERLSQLRPEGVSDANYVAAERALAERFERWSDFADARGLHGSTADPEAIREAAEIYADQLKEPARALKALARPIASGEADEDWWEWTENYTGAHELVGDWVQTLVQTAEDAEPEQKQTLLVRAANLAERSLDADAAFKAARLAWQANPDEERSAAFERTGIAANRIDDLIDAWVALSQQAHAKVPPGNALLAAGRIAAENGAEQRAVAAWMELIDGRLTDAALVRRIDEVVESIGNQAPMLALSDAALQVARKREERAFWHRCRVRAARASEAYASAIESLKELQILSDDRAAVRGELVELLTAAGDWHGLADLYEGELRRTRDDDTRLAVVTSLIDVYNDHLAEPQLATQALMRAARSLPDNEELHGRIVAHFESISDHDGLVDYLMKRGHRLKEPSIANEHYVRAARIVHSEVGDNRRVVRLTELVLRNEPRHIEALTLKALALKGLGKVAEAAQIEESLRGSADPDVALAATLASARRLKDMGDAGSAVAMLRADEERFGVFPDYQLALASALLADGQLDDARAAFAATQAIGEISADMQAAVHMGLLEAADAANDDSSKIEALAAKARGFAGADAAMVAAIDEIVLRRGGSDALVAAALASIRSGDAGAAVLAAERLLAAVDPEAAVAAVAAFDAGDAPGAAAQRVACRALLLENAGSPEARDELRSAIEAGVYEAAIVSALVRATPSDNYRDLGAWLGGLTTRLQGDRAKRNALVSAIISADVTGTLGRRAAAELLEMVGNSGPIPTVALREWVRLCVEEDPPRPELALRLIHDALIDGRYDADLMREAIRAHHVAGRKMGVISVLRILELDGAASDREQTIVSRVPLPTPPLRAHIHELATMLDGGGDVEMTVARALADGETSDHVSAVDGTPLPPLSLASTIAGSIARNFGDGVSFSLSANAALPAQPVSSSPRKVLVHPDLTTVADEATQRFWLCWAAAATNKALFDASTLDTGAFFGRHADALMMALPGSEIALADDAILDRVESIRRRLAARAVAAGAAFSGDAARCYEACARIDGGRPATPSRLGPEDCARSALLAWLSSTACANLCTHIANDVRITAENETVSEVAAVPPPAAPAAPANSGDFGAATPDDGAKDEVIEDAQLLDDLEDEELIDASDLILDDEPPSE